MFVLGQVIHQLVQVRRTQLGGSTGTGRVFGESNLLARGGNETVLHAHDPPPFPDCPESIPAGGPAPFDAAIVELDSIPRAASRRRAGTLPAKSRIAQLGL